ncbi:hypothetical protein [Streptomyces sp. NPDC058371]
MSGVRRADRDGSVDEGTMWVAGLALTEVTAEVEARIGALVKQAVS